MMIRHFRFPLAALLACATVAFAAPGDTIADAVAGKPNLTAPTGGAASSTNLVRPYALAEDPVSGELWVADYGANRVLRFASAKSFADGEAANLVLGQADFTANAPNRGGAVGAHTLSHPAGLAVDGARRLHVADTDNHRVLVFKPPYTNGMDASHVFGQSNMVRNGSNRDLGVTAAGLFFPQGLAIDLEGRLLVADAFNSRVLRLPSPIDANGLSADTVLGQADLTSNVYALSATGMRGPVGVTVGPDGHVWVADIASNRVTRYASPPAGAKGPAADAVICQANFTSDVAGVTDRVCNQPTAVVVDAAHRVHVADYGNNRVLAFAPTGPGAVAWYGQEGPSDQLCNRNATVPGGATLCEPRHLALDRHGNLLVADAGNGRVLRYDVPSPRIAPGLEGASPEWIVRGSGDFDLTVNGLNFSDDSVVMFNGLSRPTRFIHAGRLIARIAAADVPVTDVAPIEVLTPPVDGIGGGVSYPQSTTVYDRLGGDARADFVLGQPNFAVSQPFNRIVGGQAVGALNPASLGTGLRGLAVDPASGRVFASDDRGRVLSWPNVALLQNAQAADVVIGRPDAFTYGCTDLPPGATTTCTPWGLAVDGAGRLYVADGSRHRVLRFDPPFRTGMAAARVFGQGGSFTATEPNRGGLSADSLKDPAGVAVSGNRLFIHDRGNARILVFDNPDAGTTATAVIGQPDMVTGAARAASATSIGTAGANLAADAQGRLHVADAEFNRVLRYSPPYANGMAADLVVGQADFTSTGRGLSATGLDFPTGVAVDAAGNLLVADTGHSRVLQFPQPLASGMAASEVLGQAGLGAAVQSAGTGGLNGPSAVAVGPAGHVLVADAGNARIVGYDRPFDASLRVNLGVTVGASSGTAALEKDLVVTLAVRNAGPASATRSEVAFTQPKGSPFVWYQPGCAKDKDIVTCPLGTLAPGESATRRVVVRPQFTGPITLSVRGASREPDSDLSDNERNAPVNVVASPQAAAVQRYRLFSPVTLEHLYTTDLNEYNTLGAQVGTWVQEGTIGRVLDNPGSYGGKTATPYYRLYNSANRQHHWTTDPNEYYTLGLFPQYVAEGVDGWILGQRVLDAIPLFRLLYPFDVPVAGLHHWTIDPVEYQALVTQYGWVGEGGSGFVLP